MTKEETETQMTVLRIVKQISLASVEKGAKTEGSDVEESPLEHEICQGKSVVFSLLEIGMLIVSKKAPETIPAANKSFKESSLKRKGR